MVNRVFNNSENESISVENDLPTSGNGTNGFPKKERNIRAPESKDYKGLITFDDLGKEPGKLITLAGGLENILKEDREPDTFNPKLIIIDHPHRREFFSREMIEVRPGYTMLVYRNGKKVDEKSEGFIKPSFFGNTSIIEIFTQDIEHTINFPLVVVKSQLDYPARINLTYRITDPEMYLKNRETLGNGGLRNSVLRVFNNGKISLHKNDPSLITGEDNQKINQQLIDDISPFFRGKGMELKDARFYSLESSAQRAMKKIEGVIKSAYTGSSQISDIKKQSEIDEKKRLIELAEMENRFDKIKRDYKREETVDDLELKKVVQTHEESMREVTLLGEIKRDEMKYELRKKMVEYTQQLVQDLEKSLSKETDPIIKLSIYHDFTIVGKFVLGDRIENHENRKFVEEYFSQQLRNSEINVRADAYAKTHPSEVEKAKAYAGVINEMRVTIGEDKVREVMDYLHDFFDRVGGDKTI